ncbi:MAG: serine acetyltransferase [Deltaproteobacteria bacterium]|nr:serine acetyltransferase [Deltaproteobacteria bacterium]
MIKDICLAKECIQHPETVNEYYERIPEVIHKLVSSCNTEACYDHVGYAPIPSREIVIQIIHQARRILFPGYFTQNRLDAVNLEYSLGQEATDLFQALARQIVLSIQHDCLRHKQPSAHCNDLGHGLALEFLQCLPNLRGILGKDIRATLEGDPAARSYDEVIFSYPGLFATTVYRMAHCLHRLGVPIIPRIMTQYAHSHTGIDIHPGATIGESFFIDHGTGVVIGETSEIGERVRLYQGVTLGALSLPRDAGEKLKNKKRHPTIEDDVIIYANSTILGGETVIGARSIIGGNVWLTESVPPDTKVMLKRPELVYIGSNHHRSTNHKKGD